MKKKIVFIINSLKNGGPVNMLYTLVKYIDKSEFDVMVVSLKQCQKDNERDFSCLKCELIVLNTEKLRDSIKKGQEIVDKWKPDVVHSHGGVADVVNSRLKGSHISFSTIHCNPDEDFAMKKGKIYGWLRATVFLHTQKRIDHPIACSETVAHKIKTKRGIQFDFIRNGIDLERLSVEEEITRKQLHIDEDAIVLTFCGYLSKRKNVSFLVKAIKHIKRENICLLIIGDGTEYKSLKNMSSNDKRIIYVGRSSCPVKYLKISDFFISASLSEGLPLAVMEGLGCGLPALLSDIDAHNEIKRCCDKAVQIFSLKEASQLEKICENITINEQAKVNAKQIVYEYFNARRMAADYERRYMSIE